LKSFANAGGGLAKDLEFENDGLTTSDDDVSEIEFEPDTNWTSDDACSRWIVIDGVKPTGQYKTA